MKSVVDVAIAFLSMLKKLKKATGAITRQRPSKLRVKLHVAQSGDDQRKLSAVQGALLSPAHAFEQGFERFEPSVAEAQVIEKQALLLPLADRMPPAAFRIIGSCQLRQRHEPSPFPAGMR